MRLRTLWPALLLAAAVACDDTLTVEPSSDVVEQQAIIDARSARAALAGLYDALQSGSYYGGEFLFFTDLMSPDVQHVGTFSSYGAADANQVRADNETIENIWEALYATVGRANQLIARVPGLANVDEAEKNDIVGQAHFVRALAHHDLVKLFGGVPLRLEPEPDVTKASAITRSSVQEVYAQILSDLDRAEDLIQNERDTRRANLVAVDALRSRVYLWQQNWQGVITAANSVLASGVSLAANYPDLFTAEGNNTPEDIFRLSFTAVDYTLAGFYYFSRSLGGRREIGPACPLILLVSPNVGNCRSLRSTGALGFRPTDPRGAWSIFPETNSRAFGTKFPTPIGAEDFHVIRLAEVLLSKAEAFARLNQLDSAIATVNLIRARAGVPLYTLAEVATDPVVPDQTEVLRVIWRERRIELMFEGFSWPDLVRTGQAQAVLGIEAYLLLWPIPQNEMDIAPNIAQNPGY